MRHHRADCRPHAGPDAPALQLRRACRWSFPDGTHALGETTFDVRPGEFVTVVGPSGCGKTTLLRIASGLNPPTTGIGHGRPLQPRLRVPGRDAAAVAQRRAATSS